MSQGVFYNEIPSQSSGVDSAYLSQPFTISDDEEDNLWRLLELLRDDLVEKGLLPSYGKSYTVIKRQERQLTISEIKSRLVSYIDKLTKNKSGPVGLLNRKLWCNTEVDELRGLNIHSKEKMYTFIGEKRKAQLLTLMCRILEAIHKNSKVTKR